MASAPSPKSPAILAEAFTSPSSRSRIPKWLAAMTAGIALLLGSAGSAASAQTVAGNFGAVNIGTTSPVISLVFTFGTSDTLVSTAVLTQGAAGLDFSDAGSGTCTANTAYAANQSCTVNVTFTPRFAGSRFGAVVLVDGSGNTIATGYLQGTGVGPQIVFQPGTQSTLGSGFSEPLSVALDGRGDVYVTNEGSSGLYQMLSVNGTVPVSPTTKTIGSGFGSLTFVAVDAGGNLYVADTTNNAVKEILAVEGIIPASPTIRTLGSGFNYPGGVAVDGNGNVYVTGLLDNTVKEMVAVNGSIPASPTIKTLASAFHEPIGVAVDASGNVYVADSSDSAIKEILAVNGSIPASPTIKTLGSGFITPYSVAVDGSGNVYVADYGNNAVKEIVAVNGSIPASPAILTLGSGFSKPGSAAVDGAGNVYVADSANSRVVKLDYAHPPSLTFASATVGSTSNDSPRTVTIENAGNQPLSFPVPSTGNNPSITPNFTLNSSGASDCTVLNSESSQSVTLAAAASCELPISFVPTAVGPLSGSLVLIDSNLNAAAPGYATQSIALSGTGTGSFTLGNSTASLTMNQGGSGTSTVTVTGQDGFAGNVTLTASGLPSGVNATFSPNPTAGSSVLTIAAGSLSSLASSQVITITGTSGSLTATTTLILTVNPANFTLSDSTPSLNVNQGASVTSIITVNDQNGFSGNVNLAAVNLPSGVTASFSPNPTGGTSVLTLTASSTAANGTYYVSISGTSGTEVATAPNIVLTVVQPAFTVSASPASVTLAPGASYEPAIMVVYQNGLTGNISLAASGLPSGVTAVFAPNPITSTGTSILQLSASSAATPGTYSVTITGSYGSLNVATNLSLTVSQPTFSISPSVASSGMIQGTSIASTIAVMPQPGFTGSVTLAASGLPSGLTASFTPNPTTGSSVLTLTASSTAAVGEALVTVTGTSGTQTASTVIDIEIVAPSPSFSLAAAPSTVNAFQASSSTSTVSVIGQNGFDSAVNLSVYSLPSGVTASFSPNPATGTSVLTLTASASAATGTYNLIVSGTQGPGWPTESTTLMLTIAPAPGFATSSGNFGSVNAGTASSVQTLTYTFGTAVTLGSTAVLTQGAAGLDFADAGSDTCTANTAYAIGQSCTINVTFTPRFAGTRYGAAVLEDNNGNLIGTAYLQGAGVSPQIAFLPGSQSTLGSNFYNPMGTAVDGSGNVYVADETNGEVKKIFAVDGRIPSSPEVAILGSGLSYPRGVAVDGAGNVYVADYGNNAVKEIVAVNGSIPASPAILTLASGLSEPWGIAVDGSGNVYFTEPYSNTVAEIYAVDGSIPASPVIQTIGSGFNFPIGVAVDSGGNLYVGDTDNGAVKEILAVNGSIPASPTIKTLSSSFYYPSALAVDGVGNVYVSDYGTNTVKQIQAVNGSIPASPAIVTLGSGFNSPFGVAVDSSFNVYVGDTQNNRILELDLADPPSLSFATTPYGSTSTDSPQTVTVENVGNAPLALPPPPAGNNPSIAADFTWNSSTASACPLVGSGASALSALAAGTACQLPISFAPETEGALSGSLVLTDNNLNAAAPGYATQSISLSGMATSGMPAITWSAPAAIVYGTPLSSAQLNASSSVAGTFTYSPAAGIVLTAGTQTLTATFTPTDTVDYSTATTSAALTVNKATPAITWPAPAAITYGTALGATQLNAASSVAGTFTYSPAAGTMLGAGTQTLSTTFTPTNSTDYSSATDAIALVVNKVTPAITWATPAAITQGTALSAAQLDATSTIAGSFTYSPAAGTVLSAGPQTLSTTFTPTNTTDYTTASNSVVLTVNPPPSFTLAASPASLSIAQGASGTSTVTLTGKNGFSGSVALTASGLPSGVTASFSVNPTTGASVLTLTASSTATVGAATVTITGTSGSLTATTTVALTVTAKSGFACHVIYSITSQWQSGFGTSITIDNTGTAAIANWTLTFAFANGQQVTQIWNGNETQSGSNVTVTNMSYNGSIPAGGSYNGMGFNGSWNNIANAVPASFAVNGTVCK